MLKKEEKKYIFHTIRWSMQKKREFRIFSYLMEESFEMISLYRYMKVRKLIVM